MAIDTTNQVTAAAISAVVAPSGLMPKATTRANASSPIAPMIAPSRRWRERHRHQLHGCD